MGMERLAAVVVTFPGGEGRAHPRSLLPSCQWSAPTPGQDVGRRARRVGTRTTWLLPHSTNSKPLHGQWSGWPQSSDLPPLVAVVATFPGAHRSASAPCQSRVHLRRRTCRTRASNPLHMSGRSRTRHARLRVRHPKSPPREMAPESVLDTEIEPFHATSRVAAEGVPNPASRLIRPAEAADQASAGSSHCAPLRRSRSQDNPRLAAPHRFSGRFRSRFGSGRGCLAGGCFPQVPLAARLARRLCLASPAVGVRERVSRDERVGRRKVRAAAASESSAVPTGGARQAGGVASSALERKALPSPP
jgi:hypothetical protein